MVEGLPIHPGPSFLLTPTGPNYSNHQAPRGIKKHKGAIDNEH